MGEGDLPGGGHQRVEAQGEDDVDRHEGEAEGVERRHPAHEHGEHAGAGGEHEPVGAGPDGDGSAGAGNHDQRTERHE